MTINDFSFIDGLLIVFAVGISVLMLRRTIRDAPFWRATVTPLASIIGSGFLIVAPLLTNIAGIWAIPGIVGIVLLSFWLGGAIRFNILHENQVRSSSSAVGLERLSDIALALAFVISITFYIRLMSGFILTGIDLYTPLQADVLATVVLAFIGVYGLLQGLHGLERLEEYSVTLKLAIIASLLLGLIYYDGHHGYDLSGLPTPEISFWEALQQLGGMLLIVQGFETSKYLGADYSAQLKTRSMVLAQVLAGAIYIAFVALALPLMAAFTDVAPDETAIIELSGNITLVLPAMLVFAAAMSQFSAAVADTIGAGGVVENESGKWLSAKVSYPVIAILAVMLMWNSNIFELVAFASRAFALYYLLQCLLAAWLVAQVTVGWRRVWQVCFYLILACVLLFIVLFAVPVEG
jgi:hypothetical protein